MRIRIMAILTAMALLAAACGGSADSVTVYSGRTENLIQPILDQFTEETGIAVQVRYGGSADLALLIDEEGDRTPADVFISQSPGAIGFLAGNDHLQPIDSATLDLVDSQFRNADGLWVGMTGRVRVIVYNKDLVDPTTLPSSVFDLTQEQFKGQVGIAPANGSFQDFVTAMREVHGDDATAEWLAGMAANDAQAYSNNSSIVQAVGRGEIPMGLVNHYYNFRLTAEEPSLASENFYLPSGDIGSLVIVTGIGVLANSDNSEAANDLIEWMLSESAQMFFSKETLEYPLAAGVAASDRLPVLETIGLTTYDFDQLGGGLERTKELIDASGLEAP
ncbi:MAG: iron ABC transporter substrate-binding protein [Acidimicrobiia bacterium]|nr:iron ABC transporter substrate-binding protein [Acidimicrobiia bacterium]